MRNKNHSLNVTFHTTQNSTTTIIAQALKCFVLFEMFDIEPTQLWFPAEDDNLVIEINI